MIKEDVIEALIAAGSDQTKTIYMRHGMKEPVLGVKIADLKAISKKTKKNSALAFELYETGIYEAMYLAGMIVQIKDMDKARLESWMEVANCYSLSEYVVASTAGESAYAVELAKKWIEEEGEMTQAGGWSTYSNYLSIAKEEEVDLEEVANLLTRIKETIHQQPGRVKYTMNGFIICVGSYIPSLTDEAIAVAEAIGTIKVDMGKTGCKVPSAGAAIEKVVQMGRCGKKRKSCRC